MPRHAFDGSDWAQETCEPKGNTPLLLDSVQPMGQREEDWNAVNNRGAGAGNEQSLTVYLRTFGRFLFFATRGSRAHAILEKHPRFRAPSAREQLSTIVRFLRQRRGC